MDEFFSGDHMIRDLYRAHKIKTLIANPRNAGGNIAKGPWILVPSRLATAQHIPANGMKMTTRTSGPGKTTPANSPDM